MKKNKKGIFLIGLLIIIILLGGGIWFYHKQNSISGAWVGDTETGVFQLDKNGTGHYWDYADNTDYKLSWHKKGKTYHFEYQNGDGEAMFTGYLKHGKLVTKDGTGWNAETYTKSNEDIDTVKTEAQKRADATPQMLGEQKKERIWVVVTDNKNDNHILNAENNSNNIVQIIETKNGKGKSYYLNPFEDCKFKDVAGKTNSEIIDYAKKNAWHFNGGKDAKINGESDWANVKFGKDDYKGNEEVFKYGKDMEMSLKDDNNIIADAAGYTWFGWKTEDGDFLVTRDANENYNPNIHLDNLSNEMDNSNGQCDNALDVEGEILGVLGLLKADQSNFTKKLNNNNMYYTGTSYYEDTECNMGKFVYGNERSDDYVETKFKEDFPTSNKNSKLTVTKYVDPDHMKDPDPKGEKFNINDLIKQYYSSPEQKKQIENYISKIHEIDDDDLQ